MSKAPLLKRRLNPFLLASTVLVLSLLAGLSVMYQGQLSELVGDKKNLNQQIEEKNQRIAELENESSRLNAQLNTAQSDKGQLQTELNQKENTIQSLNAQISDLDSQISNLEDERDSLETELTGVRNNLSTTHGDLNQICETNQDANSTFTDEAEIVCNQYGFDY